MIVITMFYEFQEFIDANLPLKAHFILWKIEY